MSNLDKIQQVQFGRVFPWMVFKVRIGKNINVMEINIIEGCIKITSSSDGKTEFLLAASEVNGCYDMFDENTASLSYFKGNNLSQIKFDPFYPS